MTSAEAITMRIEMHQSLSKRHNPHQGDYIIWHMMKQTITNHPCSSKERTPGSYQSEHCIWVTWHKCTMWLATSKSTIHLQVILVMQPDQVSHHFGVSHPPQVCIPQHSFVVLGLFLDFLCAQHPQCCLSFTDILFLQNKRITTSICHLLFAGVMCNYYITLCN